MSGSKITKPQMGCIRAMLSKLSMTDQKDNLTLGISAERTTHLSDLSLEEAKEFIKYLKSQDPEEQSAEKMRRKIISMAHQCGYRIPGTTTVDMRKLDEWCSRYGYGHKKLNQYRYAELPKLVSQFEERYKSHLNTV